MGNRVPSLDVATGTANRNHVRGSSTVLSSSAAASSLRPHGQSPARLPSSCDFPGKKTGVGCHFQLQRLFPAQGSNPGLLHCRWILYHLNHQGSQNRCPGKANIAVYLPKTPPISLSSRGVKCFQLDVLFTFAVNISWAPLPQRLQRKCAACPHQPPGPPFRAGHGRFHSNQNDMSCQAEAGCQDSVFLSSV